MRVSGLAPAQGSIHWNSRLNWAIRVKKFHHRPLGDFSAIRFSFLFLIDLLIFLWQTVKPVQTFGCTQSDVRGMSA